MAERFKIRRSYASVLCSAAVLLSVTGVAALTVTRALWELAGLTQWLPEKLACLPPLLDILGQKTERYILSLPPSLQSYAADAAVGIRDRAALLPGELSAKLPGILSKLAGALPKAALFTATYGVSVFFISASYPQIIEFFLCQLSESSRKKAVNIAAAAGKGFGKWLRAQLCMFALMFTVLLGAFILLGTSSPLLLAFFTALVDALPVLGVGTVLLPWAAGTALGGSVSRAAALTVVWLLCLALRSFSEPRLVGRQSGLHPAAALFAAYVGWHFFGVGGLVCAPLFLVMLKELNDTKLIHLWSSVPYS